MIQQDFKPTLRDLVKVDNLPENLGFIAEPLGNFLDKFHYDNLVSFKSSSGESASYTLDVILIDEFTILEIPGTGIKFVLNPGEPNVNPASTVFNVSVDYRWEILRYIKNVKLSSFSFDVQGFVNLISNVFGVTQEEMVTEAINVFIGDIANPPAGVDPLQDFIDNYNNKYNQNISATTVASAINQISVNHNPLKIVVDDYLDNVFEKLTDLIAKWVGPLNEESLKKLLIPQFGVSLNDVSFGVTFPRNILVPLDQFNQPFPEPAQSILRVNAGSFSYDTRLGFRFEKDLSIDFTRSEIGKTGLVIEVENAKLDFSKTNNIPEANLEGRPPEFMGVYAEKAVIGLPEKWFENQPAGTTAEIIGENLLIGTGGISGKLSLVASTTNPPLPTEEPELIFKLGKNDNDDGFALGFKSFDMTFQQNSILESNVRGSLTIPKFEDSLGNPAKIDIEMNFQEDGDFKITASEDDGIPICIPNVMELTINQLSAGRVDDRFYVELIGSLIITNGALADSIQDPIEIKKLIVWSDGSIEFIGGGTVVLPKPASLKVGPVELSITAVHFGSHEQVHDDKVRKYLYFGFDGGIAANPGGIDARGDGIKFYFTIDNNNLPAADPEARPFHFFIRIESIRIDLIIPGNVSPEEASLLLSGYLSMKEAETPGGGQEYIGGVQFSLPQAQIAGGAAMRMNPKTPAFLIDVNLELPGPIPLGPTGLGIYGFRGLFGQRYVASQEAAGVEEGPDWYPYYKAKIGPDFMEGVQASKFADKNGFSVGVGASIATTQPNEKKALTTKVFFLLSMPDVFLIQGQAAFVKERIGLDITQDPPFSMMLAITNEAIMAGIGVDYAIKEDEQVLSLSAKAEVAFFFQNASAWYVHIGTDVEPVTGLVFKDVLTFELFAFLMISGSGIRAGAGISFEQEYSLLGGVLSAHLQAYVDIGGKINFKPRQIGAHFMIGGMLDLRAFGIGINITAALAIAAEVSNPFFISGFLEACISINLFIKKLELCGKIEFTWVFDDDPNTTPIPLHKDGDEGSKARSMVTDETYSLWISSTMPTDPLAIEAGNYVIPLDAYIDFDFLKPIKAGAGVDMIGGPNGAGNGDQVPQKKGKLPPVKHTFTVEAADIYYWDPGTGDWEEYDVYGALTPLADASVGVTLPPSAERKNGYWQLTNGGQEVNRLSMLARSPLEWTRQTPGPVVLEDYGIFSSDIFCPPEAIAKTCLEFGDYPTINIEEDTFQFHNDTLFQLINADGTIVPLSNPFGATHALEMEQGSQLEIIFAEPTSCIDVSILTCNRLVTVNFYAKIDTSEEDLNGAPVMEYDLVTTEARAQQSLFTPINYADENLPIDRIVIDAGICVDQTRIECGPITQEAKDLLTLLNALNDNQRLLQTAMTDLTVAPYDTIYNPTLSSYLSGPHNYWLNTLPADGEAGTMTAFIGSVEGGLCYLELTPVTTGQFDFSNIATFLSIQADPNNQSTGTSYSFLLTARMNDDTIVKINGVTDCYPINSCTETFVDCIDVLCKGANSQLSRLNEDLADLNKEIASLEALCNDVSGGVLNFASVSKYGLRICAQLPVLQQQQSELLEQIDVLQTFISEVCGENQTGSYHQCHTYLFSVCWLSQEDYQFNLDIPEIDDVQFDNTAMLNALSQSLIPIWRPNTTFLIKLHTRDQLAIASSATNDAIAYYGFRTDGPMGHWHLNRPEYDAAVLQDRQDEFSLAKLKPYIDFDKSYPDANGKLLNAKPLFYDCPRLALFFIHPQAYTMLNSFDALGGLPAVETFLEVIIKDPIEAVDAREQTGFLPPDVAWETNSVAQVTTDVTLLNNMIGDVDCIQVDNFQTLGMQLNIQACDLKPLKMYTALYNAVYQENPQLIHSYPFQTSRYACFKEQIESYQIFDEDDNFVRGAFFDLEKAFDPAAEIDKALDIINGTLPDTDGLWTEFQHIYDRIIDGAFRLEAMEVAEGTDFTIIRDISEETGSATSGNIIGVLVRNLEPFNDPKLQSPDVDDTIVVLDSFGNVDSSYNVILSKDGAKALITNDTLDIPGTSLIVRFRYLTYDGVAYILQDPTKDEVAVDVELYPPTTALKTSDCGAVELSLEDTVKADPVAGVVEYHFLIENDSIGISEVYKRYSDDAFFPLFEIEDIAYNQTYDVSVKPIVPGRITDFGTVCQISTKVHSFEIIGGADTFPGEPALVHIAVRDADGNLVPDYDLNVTLATTGSATFPDGPLVNIRNGRGKLLVDNTESETVTLSLVDTEGTGLNVTSTRDITFFGVGCFFEDSFTEAVDTLLPAHTPDIGDSWTQVLQVLAGEIIIDSTDNVLASDNTGNGTGVLYQADIAGGYANSDYVVSVRQVKGENNEKTNILAARIQDADNMYALRFNESETQVFKKISGVWSPISGVGPGTQDGAMVRFAVAGNTLKVYENFFEILSTTDNDLALPGTAGIGVGAIVDAADKIQNQELDDFQVCLGTVADLLLFLDVFATNGLLETVTPNIGVAWNQELLIGSSGGMEADGGTAQKDGGGTNNSSGTFYTADIGSVYPESDYEVQVYVEDPDKDEKACILGVRVEPGATDGYFVRFNKTDSQLYKRVAGTWTALGAAGGGVDKKTFVKLRVEGNDITFISDGNILLAATDTDITSTGRGGIGIGAVINANDDEKKQEFDDFAVVLI